MTLDSKGPEPIKKAEIQAWRREPSAKTDWRLTSYLAHEDAR